jgi:hypothetical protein
MAQLTVDVSMLEALMQEGGSPSPTSYKIKNRYNVSDA